MATLWGMAEERFSNVNNNQCLALVLFVIKCLFVMNIIELHYTNENLLHFYGIIILVKKYLHWNGMAAIPKMWLDN